MMPVCFMHTLSPLRTMIYLPCLLMPLLAFFVSMHLCTLAYMFMHESCLLVSSSLVPTISCGFILVFDTRDPRSLQELCLMARMSSILQHNGTMDTRSKATFVLLRHHLLFDNMFACPSVCLVCLSAPVWPFC